MDWTSLNTIFTQLFVLPFGSPMLAGLALTVVVFYIMSRMGIGMEASLAIGAGFLLVFSVTLLPINLTAVIVLILGIIFAAAVLRYWRR